ncbi:hypothetical protein SB766_21010 [Pseudomonas sp. SIMBA_077]
MQIMYWINRWACLLCMIIACVFSVSRVYAASHIIDLNAPTAHVQLKMIDGRVFDLTPAVGANRIFYDSQVHQVERDAYVAVFQVLDSNPAQPSGFCGAGNEVWLHIYQIVGQHLNEKNNVLVSSCLGSFSLASQSSGEPLQESDFSSVKWQTNGFSIEWFNKHNPAGLPLSATGYVVGDEVLRTTDVVSDDPKGRTPSTKSLEEE